MIFNGKTMTAFGEFSGVAAEEDAILMRTITNYVNNRITILGDNAFRNCFELLSVTMDNIESMGTAALYSCTALKSFSAKSAITTGSSTFRGDTSLAELNFPSLKTIENQTFYDCKSLTKVHFPSLETIKADAFTNCTGLTALVLGATQVTLANVNAFTGSAIAKGTGFVYVPEGLVNTYKTTTNWSTYASQIKSINELE